MSERKTDSAETVEVQPDGIHTVRIADDAFISWWRGETGKWIINISAELEPGTGFRVTRLGSDLQPLQ